MSTQFTFIRSLLGTAMVSGLCLPVMAADGGFFEDAKTDLLLRNYYFNRDFRDQAAPKSQIEEWAQGFILKLKSGYTPGTVGFGLDGIAMLGIKLDSSRAVSGSELLPVHEGGRAADNFGRAGVAAKMRISATELKVGELLPDIPALHYDDGRLLPQTFRGAIFDSREVAGLSLQAGQYKSVTGPSVRTWATSSTRMTAVPVLVTCKAIPATGCSRPIWVDIPCIWGCKRSAAIPVGCPCMAVVGAPWAMTCSTATSVTPMSVPGRLAMITVSPPPASPVCC